MGGNSEGFLLTFLILLALGGFWIFVLEKHNKMEKHTDNYLKRERAGVLKKHFPESTYSYSWDQDEVSALSRCFLPGKFYRYGGHLSCGTMHGVAHIHDITTRDSKNDDSVYYDNLLIAYRIPDRSPCFGLGNMKVREKGSAFASVMTSPLKAIAGAVNSITGSRSGGKISIGSALEGVVSEASCRERWELLLVAQDLSERIQEIYDIFRGGEDTHFSMVYDKEKLFIVISFYRGYRLPKLTEGNDYMVRQAGRLRLLLDRIEGLCL